MHLVQELIFSSFASFTGGLANFEHLLTGCELFPSGQSGQKAKGLDLLVL